MTSHKVLLALALVALCTAEPPASKDASSESKDKRGAIGYEHDSYSAGHGAAVALPAAPIGYSGIGIGHSPLLLQGAGLGLHGYGLAAPLALGGHGLAYGGHGLALGGHGLALGGHGLALSATPVLLGGHGYGIGGLGLSSLGGYSGYGLGVPASSLKLSSAVLSNSDSYDSYHGPSLSPPSKSYGVPSTSSYSSGFHPSPSYSGSSSYSSPSSSYGAPSSSYGPPSSSYGPPSSSYGLPSSSNNDYSTLSYSSGSSHSSRDYRSHH